MLPCSNWASGILFVFMALSVGEARANSYLYAAGPYAVFLRNDFTMTGSDTVGAVAAGGTITVSSISLASGNPTGITYSVIAGTDFVANGGGSLNGNLYDGTAGGINSSFTVSGAITNGNGNPNSAPIDFADQFNKLNALSTSLAAIANTSGSGCTNYYATITCTANAPGLNIINIPAGTSQSATGGVVNSYDLGVGHNYGIVINVGSLATAVVINVAGTSVSLGGSGWTVNGDSQKVIFNYSTATSLKLGSTGYATSLLAPGAAVVGGGGNFNGNFIALSFSGVTEFHTSSMFNGVLPLPSTVANASVSATPEPGSWALMLGGGLALWLLRRKAA